MNQPEIATRDEVLALLTAKAREGSISAAIALERALRIGAAGLDGGGEGEILAFSTSCTQSLTPSVSVVETATGFTGRL